MKIIKLHAGSTHAHGRPALLLIIVLRCGCHRRRDDLLLASSASHLSDARGWGPKEPAASARRSAGRPPRPRQHLTVVEWSPAAGSIAACPRGGGGGGGVGGGGEDGGGDRMARARRQRRRRRSLSWPAASSSSASSPPAGRFRCRGGSTRRRGTGRGGGQRER